MKTWTGKDLIEAGFKPSKEFGRYLNIANVMESEGKTSDEILSAIQGLEDNIKHLAELKLAKQMPLQDSKKVRIIINIDNPTNALEDANLKTVIDNMRVIATLPTVKAAAIMPDACPAGFIPVGAVVAAENAIHPGMHSSDVCCSMFMTEVNFFEEVSDVLDVVQKVSHFGAGGIKTADRSDYLMPTINLAKDYTNSDVFKDNMFLNNQAMKEAFVEHLASHGDGNHFFYVGERRSSGNLTFVTHHGSRKPGALLYKEGMRVAEKFRLDICPEAPKAGAWIPFATEEGRQYWKALEVIRQWTKLNHSMIHNAVLNELVHNPKTSIVERFWNPHNFVFRANNLFLHAKGATPVFDHSNDCNGKALIPLNMNEPILIANTTTGSDNGMGFAPHGAGRNYSRTYHKKLNEHKTVEELMKEETKGIDARFYTGTPDISELPSAYKSADKILNQINKYGLCDIADYIDPLGSMMAGYQEPFWYEKKLN